MKERRINNKENGGKAIARTTNPEYLKQAFAEFREVVRLDKELGRHQETPVLPDTGEDAFPHLPR